VIEKTNSNKSLSIFYLLLSAFSLIYIYTFLHESGHAIIGVISGGNIKEFVIGFNARVKITGANYNTITAPLGNAFGAFLPYIFALIVIYTYNEKIKNKIYHIFCFLISVMVPGSLIAWIIIPLLYYAGISPKGDDVTKFLNNSNIEPYLVALIALILITTLLYLAFRVKKIHRNYFLFLKELRSRKIDLK